MYKNLIFFVAIFSVSILFGQENLINSSAKNSLVKSYLKCNELLGEIEIIYKNLEKKEKTIDNVNQVKILKEIYYTSKENLKESKELIDFMRKNRFGETEIEKEREKDVKIIKNINSILNKVVVDIKSEMIETNKNKNIKNYLKQILKNRSKHKKKFVKIINSSKNLSVFDSLKEIN